MKKFIFIVTFLLTGIPYLQAQRMLVGKKGIEMNTGIVSDHKIGNDFYLNAALSINGKNTGYQLWILEYTRRYHPYKGIQIPQETYTAQGGYSFFILGDARRNVTLNTGITGVLGYESINKGEPMLYDGAKIVSKNNFIYGAAFRLSLETYLSDRLVLLLQGNIKILWGTDLEQFRSSTGIGIRYNF